MNQPQSSSNRFFIGFALATSMIVGGYTIRYQVAKRLFDSTDTPEADGFSFLLKNTAMSSLNAEIGWFLIALGGLVFLLTFWRWLGQ